MSCVLKKLRKILILPLPQCLERGHTISSVKAEFSELNEQVVMVASALGNDVRVSGQSTELDPEEPHSDYMELGLH